MSIEQIRHIDLSGLETATGVLLNQISTLSSSVIGLQSTTGSYVPYTGAISNVNLGNKSFTASSVSTLQIIFGDGSTQTTAGGGLQGVPYTGATANVDLRNFSLSATNLTAISVSFQSMQTGLSTTTGSMTLSEIHQTVLANSIFGSLTTYLPSALGISGRKYDIKKIDNSTNLVVIKASSGQLIDGLSSQTISSQYASLAVISDNTQWFIF